MADVAADSGALLDPLGLDTCLSLGWSGGGPHSLACGALLPDRCRAAASGAGVAPYDADGLDFLAGHGPRERRGVRRGPRRPEALAPLLRPRQPELPDVDGRRVADALGGLCPPVDVASSPASSRTGCRREFRHGCAAGVDGWLDDDLAFTRPWGFDLGAITVPTYLWQGSEDLMVPFAHGQWLAEHVPGCAPHLEQGEGHLSLWSKLDRIFDDLTDLAGL